MEKPWTQSDQSPCLNCESCCSKSVLNWLKENPVLFNSLAQLGETGGHEVQIPIFLIRSLQSMGIFTKTGL